MSEPELLQLRVKVGMLFQENAIFDSLTVRDNVGYQLLEARVPDEEVDRRVHAALTFVDLAGYAKAYPPDLSGGMQRRVAVARAIITDPSLLLYDSPTGGLDPVTGADILDLIIKQQDSLGSSALMVTERIQDAFRISTHHFNAQTNQVEGLPAGQEDKNTRYLFLETATSPLMDRFSICFSRATLFFESFSLESRRANASC